MLRLYRELAFIGGVSTAANSLLSIESWATLRARGSHRGTVVMSVSFFLYVPLSWIQSDLLCLSY